MNGPTIGELCAGYGGLGMGVKAALGGGRIAWVSDVDKGANKVLAHRFPDAPNIGDMTTVDWSQVEPVDVLTGGTPCQDLSHAGKRAGMTEGTRSNLWVSMREAIATIRPSLVVWENVGGAYSAAADSEMESDPGRLGDRPGGPVLRALGRVLGDLASLGYVGGWHGLRAADVGAPHGRLRVFVVATDAERGGRDGWSRATGGSAVGGTAPNGGVEGPLLPTPRALGQRTSRHAATAAYRRSAPSLDQALEILRGEMPRELHDWDEAQPSWQRGRLLPTPAVNDMGEGKTPEAWDEWTAKMKAAHGNGNGHGASLAIELQRIESCWGPFAPAVEHWESMLGQPAPPPSEPVLVRQWMMGLPAGWITDTPGVTRNEALKLCGNGVVPQQCEAAVRFLLANVSEVAA